jgi:hypothetical protein
MSSSSSTSNFKPSTGPNFGRRFALRLFLFLLPLALVAITGASISLLCGELLPVSAIVWLQGRGTPFIFLPQLSDHSYRLKLDAVLQRKPEAIAMGSSRANQWRSAMFGPTHFYNAANSVFLVRDFHRMLAEFDAFSPRIIILSVDYFTFVPAFETSYWHQSHDEVGGWASPEQIRITLGVLEDIARTRSFPWPSHNAAPALGLLAIKSGVGFRLDGSYNYGSRAFDDGTSSVSAIEAGKQWPLVPADRLDDSILRDFERFTELAKQKGITLVGVTMPYIPKVREAMERSPHYGAWRQFQSVDTKEWIRKQGVLYFDFSELGSFGGRPDEFADPYHPSEPAYIRMLLSMLGDERFRPLFPGIKAHDLQERLKGAARLEAYRDDF